MLKNTRWKQLLAVFTLALSSASQASEGVVDQDCTSKPDTVFCREEAAARAGMAETNRRFAQLLPSLVTSPRKAIAAAMLLAIDPALREHREHWLAVARRDGGNDPLIQAVLATQILRVDGRKRIDAQALKRLQEIDPDNAFAWLPTLHAGNPAAATDRKSAIDALRRAAQASRYDDYGRELERELYSLAKHVPWTADQRSAIDPKLPDPAFIHARGVMMALWVPGFQNLMETCRSPQESLRDDCKIIAGLLVDEQRNLLENRIGRAMLRRLETDPLRLAELEEETRIAQWRQTMLNEYSRSGEMELLAKDQASIDYLIEHGEQAAMLRALQHEGIPALPPPGWSNDQR